MTKEEIIIQAEKEYTLWVKDIGKSAGLEECKKMYNRILKDLKEKEE